MPNRPATRPSLILRIRDRADVEAWNEFARLYGPVVYRYGRGQGLQDADAADLAQEVLRAVANGIGRLDYDRARGSFCGWVYTLAHHKFHDQRRRGKRQARGTGEREVQEQLEALPAPEGDEALWNREYQQRLFDWAAEQARGMFQEKTWRAFWMTAVERKSGQEAAAALGITLAAAYLAKGRVMARLRALIAEVEGA